RALAGAQPARRPAAVGPAGGRARRVQAPAPATLAARGLGRAELGPRRLAAARGGAVGLAPAGAVRCQRAQRRGARPAARQFLLLRAAVLVGPAATSPGRRGALPAHHRGAQQPARRPAELRSDGVVRALPGDHPGLRPVAAGRPAPRRADHVDSLGPGVSRRRPAADRPLSARDAAGGGAAMSRLATLILLLLLAACEPMTENKQPPYSGDPERGRELTHAYGCGSCHRIPQVPGARGQVGPSLVQIARRGYIAGLLPNYEEQMVRWLQAP